MTIKTRPKSRETNLVVQNLENETLVYDLRTNQAFCLNKTSGLVWQYCNGKNSVSDISDLMSKKMQTLVSEDFVLLALNEIGTNNLLENIEENDGYFNNLNRREMVKRCGMASFIALPIISSVIAPTAANAQSVCITNNQPVSCEVTLATIGAGICSQATVFGPNAWRCIQSACCSGTCITLDPADPGNRVCE